MFNPWVGYSLQLSKCSFIGCVLIVTLNRYVSNSYVLVNHICAKQTLENIIACSWGQVFTREFLIICYFILQFCMDTVCFTTESCFSCINLDCMFRHSRWNGRERRSDTNHSSSCTTGSFCGMAPDSPTLQASSLRYSEHCHLDVL